MPCYGLEWFSSLLLWGKKVSIHITCGMIFYCKYIEWIGGSLPCLRFNYQIRTRSFVVGMWFVKRPLMGKNMFEFPHNIFIILVYNFIDIVFVLHNLLVLIIINRTYELDVNRVLCHLFFMLINHSNKTDPELFQSYWVAIINAGPIRCF